MKKLFNFRLLVLIGVLIMSISQMWARTFSGGEIIYIKNDGQYSGGGGYGYSIARLILRTTSESNTGATLVTMTNVTGNTDYYKVVMPAGTWNYMLVVRTNATTWSSCSWGGGPNEVWNNTWQLSIDGTANMFQGFKEGTANGSWHWMIPKGATFYFDKTNIDAKGEWGSSVYLRIGRSNHAAQYGMSGPVTGTDNLYKYTMTGNYVDYAKFIVSNNYGFTGNDQDIVNIGGGNGNVAYISHQLEYVINTTLTGLDYTFIPDNNSNYKGDNNQCTYYRSTNYNYKKTWTITCTSVDHATVELYYYDPSNTKQIVSEGSSAQVLPTTKVWCKVTPDDGYALTKVNLYDPSKREWTDASREDGSFDRNCYVVRTDVTFEAVIEPYKTMTILVNDVNSWAPNMYFKGWNPFLYEDYDNSNYHYTTQKVSDKITLCSKDYYVVTISNEFPFYYIHNENDASRTAFFATNRLTHMAKYDDYTSGTGDWGLRSANCGDAIYWVETYKGTGPKYISNIVSNVADTMSFYVESGGTVDFHAGTSPAANQYSTLFAKYFAAEADLYGKAGGVFTATPNAGGTGLANEAIFDGDYHIHVNAITRNYLNAGGVGKSGTIGTKFTKFDKSSLFGDSYDHYWVDWFLGSGDGKGAQSVVATVGNAYNVNLAGVLGADAFAPKGMTQADGGNVRYGYNPETNFFERAIVSGDGEYIKLQGSAASTVMTGTSYNNDTYSNPASFGDATNWVYDIKAQVKGQSCATVSSTYNAGSQTPALNKKLMGGNSESTYTVEITYDFKTNRLVAAWNPDPLVAITGFNLESNLMAVRTENGSPAVLNIQKADLDEDKITLSSITKIYTVLELTQANWLDASAHADRRIVTGSYVDEYYWISLPYDCYIGDIFGIEGYGSNGSWVLQTYHGDYRAKKGWWAETENWWYDMERTDTLKANKGYVLRVTNLNGDNSVPGLPRRFADGSGTNKLYLYFPSMGSDLSLGLKKEGGALASSMTTTIEPLPCTIVRDEANHAGDPNYDRRAIDSNWNIIGSPSFNSTKITSPTWGDEYPTSPNVKGELKFFYTWAANTDPKYAVKTNSEFSSFEFKATHAYLVQYAGDITWIPYDASNPLVVLKAPKRTSEENGDQTLKLVLMRDTVQADVTYISRMAEDATEDYDLNLDLSKLISKTGNNLYTIAGYYKMAGNCLPDSVSRVKVGVQLATTGDYTFALPDGTNGIGVTLVDNVTGTRTELGLTGYTVNLAAGTYNNRFELELSSISNVTTGIESNTMGETESGIRKVMIDGVLYIVRDGEVFDARGAKIK